MFCRWNQNTSYTMQLSACLYQELNTNSRCLYFEWSPSGHETKNRLLVNYSWHQKHSWSLTLFPSTPVNIQRGDKNTYLTKPIEITDKYC